VRSASSNWCRPSPSLYGAETSCMPATCGTPTR
jgi:hypothetical protein